MSDRARALVDLTLVFAAWCWMRELVPTKSAPGKGEAQLVFDQTCQVLVGEGDRAVVLFELPAQELTDQLGREVAEKWAQ